MTGYTDHININPYKKDREDTTTYGRLLSLSMGGAAFGVSLHHWMYKYGAARKKLLRDQNLSRNNRKSLMRLFQNMFNDSNMPDSPSFNSIDIKDIYDFESPNYHVRNLMKQIQKFEAEVKDIISKEQSTSTTISSQLNVWKNQINTEAFKTQSSRDKLMPVLSELKQLSNQLSGRSDLDIQSFYGEHLDKRLNPEDVLRNLRKETSKSVPGKEVSPEMYDDLNKLSNNHLEDYLKRLKKVYDRESYSYHRLGEIYRNLQTSDLKKAIREGDVDYIEKTLRSIGKNTEDMMNVLRHGIDSNTKLSTTGKIPQGPILTIDRVKRTSYAKKIFGQDEKFVGPKQFEDFWNNAKNQRYWPEVFDNLITDKRKLKLLKHTYSAGGRFEDITKLIFKKAKDADVDVKKLEVTPTNMDYGTKFDFAVTFAEKKSKQNYTLRLPFVMPKYGFMQQDPTSQARIWNLRRFGSGPEEYQLKIYENRLESWMGTLAHRRPDAIYGSPENAQRNINKEITNAWSRTFREKAISTGNMLEDMMKLMEVGPVADSMLSDHKKALTSVQDELLKLRSHAGSGNKFMTFMNVRYGQPRVGRGPALKEIALTVLERKSDGTYKVKPDGNRIYNLMNNKVHMDDFTYSFTHGWFGGRKGRPMLKSPIMQSFKSEKELLKAVFGEVDGPIIGAGVNKSSINRLLERYKVVSGPNVAKKSQDAAVSAGLGSIGSGYVDRAFIDVAKAKLLLTDPAMGKTGAMGTEALIDKFLDNLAQNTTNEEYKSAKVMVDNLYKDVLSVTRTELKKSEFHSLRQSTAYRNLTDGVLTLLMSDFDWDTNKNAPKQIQRIFSKLPDKAEKFRDILDVYLPGSQYQARVLFDPRVLTPGWDTRPQQRTFYQLHRTMPMVPPNTGKLADYTGELVSKDRVALNGFFRRMMTGASDPGYLPYMYSSGSEPIWGAMSDYYSNYNAFVASFPKTYESMSLWKESAFYGKHVVERKTMAIAEEGARYTEPNQVFSQRIQIGTSPGSGMPVYAEPGSRIISQKTENGIRKISIMRPRPRAVGSLVKTGYDKMSISEIFPDMAFPKNIDFFMHYDPFKKGDAFGIFQMYATQLSAYAGNDPMRKKHVIDAINRELGGFLSAQNTAQGIKLKYSLAHKDIEFLRDEGAFRRLGNVYRRLNLTMDKFQGVMEEGLSLVNPAVYHPYEGADPIRLNNQAIKAITDKILSDSYQNTELARKVYGEMFFQDVKQFDPFLESLRQAYEMDDVQGMRNLFSEHKIPELYKTMALMPHGSKPGDPTVVAGILTRTQAGFMPDASQRGQGGEARVSQLIVNALENQPGADELRFNLTQDMIKQSLPRLGKIRLMLDIAQGKVQLPSDAQNYMRIIEGAEKVRGTQNMQALFERMFNIDPKNYAQIANRIQSEGVYEYGGQILTRTEAMEIPKIKANEGEYLLTRHDLRGRVFRPQDVEFLKNLRTGYVTVPPGDARFVKLPGVNGKAPVEHLVFSDPGSQIFNTKKINGKEYVVLGKEAALLRNLLIKMKAGNQAGQSEAVQNLFDLWGSVSFKKGYYAKPFASVQAFTQFANVSKKGIQELMSEKIMAQEFDKRMALAHEVIFNKEYIENYASKIQAAVKNLTIDDLKLMTQYMRNYSGTIGVQGARRAAHPSFEFAKQAFKKAGSGYQSLDGLFEDVMNFHKKKIDITQLRKAWAKGVQSEALPLPSVVWRHPTFLGRNVLPVMSFFRTVGSPGEVKDASVFLSSLVGKGLGADTDGDLNFALLAPKGTRNYFMGMINDPDSFYNQSHVLDVFSKRAEGQMMYDPKIHGMRWGTETEFKNYLNKEAEKYFGTDLTTMFADDATEHGNYIRYFMKHPAGTGGKIMMTTRNMLKSKHEYTQAEKRGIYKHIGSIGEWILKGKGRGGNVVPTIQILNDIENMTDPDAVERLLRITKGEEVTYPAIDAVRSKSYAKAGKFRYMDPVNKDSIGGMLSTPVGHLDGPWKDIRKRFGESIKRKDATLFNWMQAMNGETPNVFKFGGPFYFLESSKTTVADVTARLAAGQAINSPVASFLDVSQNVLPLTAEENAFKSLGKWMTMGFNEKTMAKAHNLGSIAAGVALAYVGMQAFRPDQMKSLGHMPGTGGEMWDHSFTNPEMDYEKFMTTPLGNPYDLPKAYIDLFNPRKDAAYIKSTNRERHNNTTMPSIRPFRSRSMIRNTYMNTSSF